MSFENNNTVYKHLYFDKKKVTYNEKTVKETDLEDEISAIENFGDNRAFYLARIADMHKRRSVASGERASRDDR